MTIKSTFPGADPFFDPGTQGVTLEIGDVAGSVFHTSFVPAGGFTRRRNTMARGLTDRMEAAGAGGPIVYVFSDPGGDVAGGLRRATVRLLPGGVVAKTKFRIRRKGLETAGDLPAVTLALLFGADPSAGTCVSARGLACRGGGRRFRCGL